MQIKVVLVAMVMVLVQDSVARTVNEEIRYLLGALTQDTESSAGLYNRFTRESFEAEEELEKRSGSDAKPRSCAEVKSMKGVTSDGDQCLAFDCSKTKGVKVYCGKMDTDSPKEYVTLPRGEAENYSFTDKHGSGCIYGKISFSKLNVNLADMTINVLDESFTTKDLKDVNADGSNKCDSYPMYGYAFSCSNAHTSRPKGEYKINLEGTGFYVPDKVEWASKGWYPTMGTQQRSDQTLSQQCTGSCGGCYPNGGTGDKNYLSNGVMAIGYDWVLDSSQCDL